VAITTAKPKRCWRWSGGEYGWYAIWLDRHPRIQPLPSIFYYRWVLAQAGRPTFINAKTVSESSQTGLGKTQLLPQRRAAAVML
jgi:hypothetical protein